VRPFDNRVKAIQQKLDRLDEAFLYPSQSTSPATAANATSCAKN
jgi:hypothetical protein